jgi:AbrB family looped-hinge helix DNA binding protein
LITFFQFYSDHVFLILGMLDSMEKSLGFVAVQSRGGIITIPAEARRALRLDAPGAQVEVILRDNDLVLIPHVAVPLEEICANGGKPAPGPGS